MFSTHFSTDGIKILKLTLLVRKGSREASLHPFSTEKEPLKKVESDILHKQIVVKQGGTVLN